LRPSISPCCSSNRACLCGSRPSCKP
jgi:hypothetical protein